MEKIIEWSHGSLHIQTLGGMVGLVEFKLPDGRKVSPFQVAPWSDDHRRHALPGVLQRLRGEWPCVPFGVDKVRHLPDNWPSVVGDEKFCSDLHGYSANHDWTIDHADDEKVVMSIDYPRHHPIEMLRRKIVPVGPALDFELTVIVREACDLPFGFHPTYKVTGAMRIAVEQYNFVHSFPTDAEPGAALFVPNQVCDALDSVAGRDGQNIDATCVPLPQSYEELLQVVGGNGQVALHVLSEGYKVQMTWQKEHFGSLLLWYSNRGRTDYPWNAEHQALGIEPICSAFDLGQAQSKADNPISRRGTPTTMTFRPDKPFHTTYRIGVSML